ncbi:TcaA 3rd/4th domain-containing protein [Clostridium sp. SGI.024]|uniref:TcaA 3rd/4th domain-containing protein n=1 Tax=Clostridium sp. SGI.024 TaxID=3420551 RepID=UPI003D07046D
MKRLKELFEALKRYLHLLIEDIRNIKFSNLKEFIIRRKVILIVILLVFAGIGFEVGSYKSSKNIILKNLEVALIENKPRRIYKDIKVDGERISKKEFEPLADYYFENEDMVNNIIKDLKNNGESGFFKLINKKILLFDNYHIEIAPVAIKVNCNFDETKIYINDEKIAETKIKRNLIPGKYSIKGKLNTLYGEIEEKKEVYIMENLEYKLDMPAINITLTSNFEDANVLIDGKEINKQVKDMKKYGPIPLNKNIKIQLEREFPWGLIASEKVEVSNLPNLNINIDIVNDELIEEVNKSTNDFYTSVFEALNNSDYSLIANAEDDAKSKIYDSIKKESLFLKNNYEITDLKTELKSSEFYYENGIYKGNVVIKLNYNIKKKLVPFWKNNVEEMFLTNIEYKNNNWIINDVQKFSID